MKSAKAAIKEIGTLLSKKEDLLKELADAEIKVAKARRGLADIRKGIFNSQAFLSGVISPDRAARWR